MKENVELEGEVRRVKKKKKLRFPGSDILKGYIFWLM